MSCAATPIPVTASAARIPFVLGPTVDNEAFQRIQRRMALDCCKWDSQIADVSTLYPRPLLIHRETWRELSTLAEELAAELVLAERELLERPELYFLLGIPAKLRSVFEEARRKGLTPCAVRVLRFDFHYSTEGWRISEVNSDVPGGYTEASCFSELMAAHLPHARPAGNPADRWTEAMISMVGEHGRIALLSAPGFLEDQQITAFLAGKLHDRGVDTFLLHHPSQLSWESGRAGIATGKKRIEMGALVRFYQGEWLAKLPRSSGWRRLFAGGRTPVSNPGSALLTESKRFPLIWDRLQHSKMARWRTLLPACCDAADSQWKSSGWRPKDDWVLKAAFSNTGDAVYMSESMSLEAWQTLCRLVKRHPEHWIAQQRFEPRTLASDRGALYPCFGVYTVDGRAAGVYTRAGAKQVIDHAAMELALLIDEHIHAR